MRHKRYFIGGLITFLCVSFHGAAQAQCRTVIWTGEWQGSSDCDWSTPENWAQVGGIAECDILILTDTTPCPITVMDTELPPGPGYFPVFELHVGHGVIISLEANIALWVRGMMFITGTVGFEGQAGAELNMLGLRLGQLDNPSGNVLTNATFVGSPLIAGVSDGNDCVASCLGS